MATPPAAYGYPKTSITADKLPIWQQPLSRFTVAGPNDWRVSSLASIDRGIRVEVGTGSGDAVTDVTFDYETMSLPSPDVAARWYLIVRRRNWSGTGTSTLAFVVATASATPALPSRFNTPGERSDQPLALVRVTQKDSTVQQIIDLRAWASNGGVEVADKLALSYLATPGAAVKLRSSMWRYERKSNGVWGWFEYPLLVEDSTLRNIGNGGTAFGVGWSAFVGGGYSRLAYRKVGNLVHIYGAARVKTAVGPASVVAVMPAGLRPSGKVPGIRCEMNPDGALRAEFSQVAGATPSFFVSYFVA